jgi:hypothetical protein
MATRRRICRIRVLAKMVILGIWPDSIHSPTFANLFWSDSIHSSTFATLLCPDSIHSSTFTPYFARTRYICPHSPKGFFEKNVTRLDTFARVIRQNGEFGASGHCLIETSVITFVFCGIMKTVFV